MTLMRIKGIKRAKAKGRVYYYHRKTGERIDAPHGSDEFLAEVARLNAKAAIAEPVDGTLGGLIKDYRASVEYTDGLKPRTRADYDDVFDYLKPVWDTALIEIDGPLVFVFRDKAFKHHKRRFANYVVQVLRLLFTWALPRRRDLKSNPAMGVPLIPRPKGMEKANRRWHDKEIDAVLSACSDQLRLPLLLGLYAGTREGDMLALTWHSYDGKRLVWKQGKTDNEVRIAVHADLKAELDRKMKVRTSPTICVSKRGTPWSADGFRASLFRLIKKLETEEKVGAGLTYHGLRSTLGTQAADGGADSRKIASALGQKSTAMADHYSQEFDREHQANAVVKLLPRTRTKRKSGKLAD